MPFSRISTPTGLFRPIDSVHRISVAAESPISSFPRASEQLHGFIHSANIVRDSSTLRGYEN